MAGGVTNPLNAAIEKARTSWEESMLRQLDELRETLLHSTPERIAHLSGATYMDADLLVQYWEKRINISWPELQASCLPEGNPCSTFDAAMLFYYLTIADGAAMADRWIGFRELPAGNFYNQAFQGYSGGRLAGVYGLEPALFNEAARQLNGWRLPALAEFAYAFQPLPRIRLAAVLWPGDEDFPAKGSILFDAAASHYMTTDGLALLGSGLAGRLIKRMPRTKEPE